MPTVNAHVFPEHGDEPDAANFAQVGGHEILSDYVLTGLNITNDGNGTFDLTAGMAYVSESSMDTQTPSIDPAETRDNVTKLVDLPSDVTDIAYTEGTDSNTVTNYIFIGPDPNSTDNAVIEVKEGDDSADDGQLLIGEISDGSFTRTTSHNRRPSTSQGLNLGSSPLFYDNGYISSETSSDTDRLVIDTTATPGAEVLFRMDDGNGTVYDRLRITGGGTAYLDSDLRMETPKRLEFGPGGRYDFYYNEYSHKFIFTRVNTGTLWEADQSGVNFPNGLREDDNDVLTTADDRVISSGNVTLSNGSAEVKLSRNDTPEHFYVALDPTGDSSNGGAEVSVSYRIKWYDEGVGGTNGYAIEIVEEGTDVGDPTVGYKIIRH